MRIQPNTSIDYLESNLGVAEREELRTSEVRRRKLEKTARILTGRTTDLKLQMQGDGAYCTKDDDGNVIINIPTEPVEQVATNLPPKIWDKLFQEVEMMHEIGHELYTDWPSMENTYYNQSLETREKFKQFWNVLEDGRIENQLRAKYAVENDLHIKNANLMVSNDGDSDELHLYQATMMAAMDLAKYDTGRLERLLDQNDFEVLLKHTEDQVVFEDQILPLLENKIPGIITEPESVKANEKIGILWSKVWDIIEQESKEDVNQMGEDDMRPEQEPDDADNRGSGSGGQTASRLVLQEPGDEDDEDEEGEEDGDDEGSQSGADGDEEEDDDSSPEERDGGQGDADESEEDDADGDGDGDGDSEGDEDGDEDALSPGSEDDLDEIEQEVQSEMGSEVRNEAQAASNEEDMLEEAKQLLNVAQEEDVDIQFPTEAEAEANHVFEVMEDRVTDARSNGRRISRILNRKLKKEKRDDVSTKQRRGKLDPFQMIPASRGDPKSFKQTDSPDGKDYRAMIVSDRSGSMTYGNSDLVDPLERSVGALTWALEDLDIPVSVLSLYRGDINVEKPYGSDMKKCINRMFTGRNDGGTPLTRAVQIARSRMDGSGYPFMIVVCDGRPNDNDTFREEVMKTNFPVLGIRLYEDESDESAARSWVTDMSDVFSRVVIAKEDELTSALRQISNEVMF